MPTYIPVPMAGRFPITHTSVDATFYDNHGWPRTLTERARINMTDESVSSLVPSVRSTELHRTHGPLQLRSGTSVVTLKAPSVFTDNDTNPGQGVRRHESSGERRMQTVPARQSGNAHSRHGCRRHPWPRHAGTDSHGWCGPVRTEASSGVVECPAKQYLARQ